MSLKSICLMIQGSVLQTDTQVSKQGQRACKIMYENEENLNIVTQFKKGKQGRVEAGRQGKILPENVSGDKDHCKKADLHS